DGGVRRLPLLDRLVHHGARVAAPRTTTRSRKPMTDQDAPEAPSGLDDATRPATGDAVIVMEGVTKRFGTFEALKSIDMVVGRQEVVVVIGPSGSGKSTLIRCINRLEVHDEGRIIVDGTELSDDIRSISAIRRETGMVFQQFNLFPHLTVLDNITLAPRTVRKTPRAEAEAQAMELLERVRIP